MPGILYNRDSFNRCNCGGCPVQLESKCVQKQEEALAAQKERIQSEGFMPDPGTMPGIYCANPVGRSPCDDLNEKKTCICPACTLAIMEGLGNNRYCLRGSAKEVG